MLDTTMISDLSPDQDAAVRASGHVFVDAGPGTGKTHVIVSRIRHLVESGLDPREILVVTFSRRAVAELKERIRHETNVACEVRTFHGFASRLLEADGPRFKSRRLLDAFAESLMLDTALKRSTFVSLSPQAVESERFRVEFARFVADLRRSDRASVRSLRETAPPRLRELFAAFDELEALHDAVRASDLDDLVARAVDALADAASPASKWLEHRYAHVLIDEFQDVDATQLELVAHLDATLFAVGDAAQAIYAFRGALAGAIDAAVPRFAMRRFTLSESRRCPRLVCDLASRTPFLAVKTLTPTRDAEGSVDVRVARTTLDEAALIADRVEAALANGLAPERIAVLVRSARPLVPAIEAEMRARNIRFAGGGRSAFLADQNVEAVRLGLELLETPSDPSRWAALLCAGPLSFDSLYVRAMLRGREIPTLAAGLAMLTSSGLEGAVAVPIFDAALRSASEAFDAGDIGRAARRLINGLGLAVRAAQRPDDVANVRSDVGRLGRVVDALAGAQRHLRALGEPASSASVLHAFESRIDAIASEETPSDDVPGVRILSIHGAKGLEFDVVIIGDAVEGRFPAASRRSTLFDDAALDAARRSGVDLLDAREDAALREEAALWYVGVTRTREALLVTYASHGSDGIPQRPTRFLPAAYHPADTIAPFERRLDRDEDLARESGDPATIAALRASLADSPTLVALLDEGADAFARLPERDVVYAKNASVSAAEMWFECPRRFHYKHVLGLTDEPGLPAVVGTALHAILAAFHERRHDFTAVSDADAETWSAELRALRAAAWPDVTIDGPIKREAYAAFADRVLTAYAHALVVDAKQHPFTVVACEYGITSTYGTGALRGKLDRIDRAIDGTLILRDYKSGRRHASFEKTLAKATKDGDMAPGDAPPYFRPQLALYRRGAEAAFGAPVGRLEYVYLNGIKGDEKSPIGNDSVRIDEATGPHFATLDAVVERDFVTAFAAGVRAPIATARKVATCTFCAFVDICPGPVEC